MNGNQILTLLYLLATAGYFFIGVYVLFSDYQSRLYQVFFSSTLSLSVWAFTMGMSNSAPTLEMALLWRRIGVLGWGTFFALILRVFIILTDNDHYLKPRWRLGLFYLPAVYAILVFGVLTDIAMTTYQLELMPFGWINIPQGTVWDHLHSVYYLGYSLVGMIILGRWGYRSSRSEDRKSARILIVAFAMTLLVGSLTEFIINGLFTTKIPQLAPILTVIPIGVIYYTLRRYGFMRTAAAKPYSDARGNLSGATRSRLYLYLGNGYFFAGFFSFVTNYLTGRESFAATTIFGGLMFLFGFLLLAVQFITIRPQMRDRLSGLILAASILVTTAQFSASDPITGWMFPVLAILVAVLLGDRTLLVMVGLATFGSMAVMLFRQPEVSLTFTLGDHLIRLLVIAIALSFGFFINRVFNQLVRENQEKTGQEKLLSQINGLFLKVSEQNLRQKMNSMLELCGEQFGAQHMLLVFHHQDGPNEGYQWFSNPQHKKNRQDAMRDYFEFRKPAELSAFMNRQLVCYSQSQSPIEPRLEEFRQAIGIESFMIQPLSDGDRGPIGFLVFSRFDRDKTCRPTHRDFLMILSHTLVDIVNKLAVEKVITYQANYDAITGLINRQRFTADLQQRLRDNRDVAVLFLDVDGFKTVNDTFGHDIGDQLLKIIGQRLQMGLAPEDLLARFGGDEFAIGLVDSEDLPDKIKGIQERFKEAVVLKNKRVFLTLSIGIARVPEGGIIAEDLMKNADLAMYAAKESGKNKAVFCNAELKMVQHRETELSHDLHQASERGELSVMYQPQIDGVTGAITGLEALIRWQHRQFGSISPGLFIPIAEKNGLINELGDWVLTEVCNQNKYWEQLGLGPVRMAVNFSLVQFMTPGLALRIGEILGRFELPPSSLVVEITESINIHDFKDVDNTVRELKTLGVAVSIDDFGTEYSSLDRLKSLPVDEIKIDKRFIDGLPKDVSSIGIIRAIIALAEIFDLELVAEGVETEEQLEFLLAAGCRVIQGYYFYPPLSAEAVGDLLRTIHEQRRV